LEENPKSEMITGTFFTQPDHARSAVNRLYRDGAPYFVHAEGAYSGPHAMNGNYLSGLYDNEYKGQEVIVQYSQSLTITSQNIARNMDDIWDKSYEAISRANTAIKHIPVTPGLDEKEKANLMGQAKFFRSYNYFWLVKTFGDVPLILEPVTDATQELYVERTPSTEVYAQIEADLKDAIGGLNNEAFTKNGFRVTKAAAETLLANAYLQMSGYPVQANKYADAASMAKSVINAGKHALISNGETPETSAYNKIRTLDDSNEYIYSMEYDSEIADNSWRPTYSFPNAAAAWGILKYSITNNAFGATDVLLNAYDPENDLRIQEKQYFFKTYTYVKDGKEITANFERPANWFFFDEDALLVTGKGAKDAPIYRYAEVLLIAAESIAQSEGVTSEAVGYLADVRARAFTKMTREDIVKSLTGLSKEAFVHEVLAERLREFPFEFKLWDDIQRTRLYPTTSASNKGKVNYVNVIGATNPWGATFQEKHLLWPISNNEMQRNPKLVQNPGY